MSRQEFSKFHNLNQLRDEITDGRPDLKDAPPLRVEGSPDGTTLWVEAPDADDAMVAAKVDAHAGLILALDKRRIAGDGQDTVTVTVRAEAPSVTLEVNGTPVIVALTDGAGALELVSDTRGTVITVRGAAPEYAQASPVSVEVI